MMQPMTRAAIWPNYMLISLVEGIPYHTTTITVKYSFSCALYINWQIAIILKCVNRESLRAGDNNESQHEGEGVCFMLSQWVFYSVTCDAGWSFGPQNLCLISMENTVPWSDVEDCNSMDPPGVVMVTGGGVDSPQTADGLHRLPALTDPTTDSLQAVSNSAIWVCVADFVMSVNTEWQVSYLTVISLIKNQSWHRIKRGFPMGFRIQVLLNSNHRNLAQKDQSITWATSNFFSEKWNYTFISLIKTDPQTSPCYSKTSFKDS